MSATSNGSKNKIIKAALHLFTKKGIKSTTTKELAQKAGIAEGTIYNYFKNKEDIANFLFKYYIDEFSEYLKSRSLQIDSPDQRMKALVRAFFNYAKEKPKAIYFIVIAHYTELNKLNKKHLGIRNIFSDTIKRGIRNKYFTKSDPNLSAAHIIGMINRAVLSYNNGFIEMDYKEMISETEKAALKLLSVRRIIKTN